MAARVGSDVGFALLGGTAVGLGRGERVTPALAAGTYHWVLAFADGQLSTPAVYAACDRLRAGRAGRADAPGPPQLDTALMAALRSGDPAELGPLLSNDLQPAAVSLLPRLRQALAAGREHGALGAIVSGSGPTCAFLARDGVHARDLAVALAGAGVCRTVASVTGPAPGATVISVPAAGGPGSRLGGPEADGRPVGRDEARARMSSPAVNLVNLERAVKAYGQRPLLDGVSAGVAAGDRIGVVGRNGAGKSTLLSVLAGTEALDSGRATRTRGLRIAVLAQRSELTGTVASNRRR